jgi:hypothetical protein
MSWAALTAATLTKPMSAVSRAACETPSNITWVWASISPGIKVRPRPAIRVKAMVGDAASASTKTRVDDIADNENMCWRAKLVGLAIEDADIFEGNTGRLGTLRCDIRL